MRVQLKAEVEEELEELGGEMKRKGVDLKSWSREEV